MNQYKIQTDQYIQSIMQTKHVQDYNDFKNKYLSYIEAAKARITKEKQTEETSKQEDKLIKNK